MTVGDCYAQWMREHVRPQLAARTVRNYEGFWSRHLRDRVGGALAIDFRPRDAKGLSGALLAEEVGIETVRKALQVLGSVFAHALELDIVDANPVTQIRKPKAPKRRQAVIVDIDTVERMRSIALDVEGSPLAAIIISLGYLGGLRPGEWRGLTWADVGERSLRLMQSTDVDGSLRGETKTGDDRSIDTWNVLSSDLNAWRAVTPFADADDPVIPTARREHWDDETYKTWARRPFRRIATAAGWNAGTPNKLRHLHASLLIKEGRLDLREIAERMGHSVEVLERRYAHEIREYRGRKISVVHEVGVARASTAEADRDGRRYDEIECRGSTPEVADSSSIASAARQSAGVRVSGAGWRSPPTRRPTGPHPSAAAAPDLVTRAGARDGQGSR